MNKVFWRAAMIRAVKTVCQTAVATIGTAAVLTDVEWRMVISSAVLAGVLSILTSVAAGLPEVASPSIFVTEDEAEAAKGEDADE